MNRLNLTASDLKSALAGFGKVINKRTTLPVLGCILFESKQGQLHLTGTNLDDYVSTAIPGSDVTNLSALIPFEVLNKVVKGCASVASLQIEFGEKEARIRYPVANTVLTETVECLPVSEFPSIPAPDWHDPLTVGEEFKQAVREALDSASDDQSRYILNHAFVDVSDPEAHYVVATSGRELYAANSFKVGFKESLIVPNRSFLLWKGFMGEGDWIVSLGTEQKGKDVQTGWIRVQAGSWTLITRQIEGEYPHWRSPIPTGDRTAHVQFTEEAREFIWLAAPRLPQSEDLNSPVTMLNAGNALILRAGNGVHEASIPVTGATVLQGSLSITMNRHYLLKAMKLGMEELEVFDDHIAVVFKNRGKRLVVARMRSDEPAKTISSPTEETTPPSTPASSSVQEDSHEQEQEKETEVKTINRIENVSTTTANTGNQASQAAPASAFDQLRARLEKLKEFHKSAVADINESLKMLAQAQRERRATDKEIEEVRETLQSLQKIRI